MSTKFELEQMVRKLQDKIAELTERLTNALTQLREADRFLAEIEERGLTYLSKDICIYKQGSRIILKVTDFEKGYWAQAPLKTSGRIVLSKLTTNQCVFCGSLNIYKQIWLGNPSTEEGCKFFISVCSECFEKLDMEAIKYLPMVKWD